MRSDGVKVIRYLLTNNPDVLALVPAVQIHADVLPQGSPLKSILIEHVGSVPRNPLRKGAMKHFRDRIQVTPNAATYDEVSAIVRAIIPACADQFPAVPGLTKIAVIFDGEGPDGFNPENNARAKPIDFIVRYNRPV